MSLFNLGKKKEDSKKAACACNNTNSAREATDIFNACYNEASEGIGCIKVLGSGCKSCHALLESTKKGVEAMKLLIEVEYITDMQKIMEYGVMRMPALVVNEHVVSVGTVLKANDVESLLRKLGF